MTSAGFNAEQWARSHEEFDKRRFDDVDRQLSGIVKVLGVAGVTLLGALGWSVKAQYDSIRAAEDNTRTELQAIQTIQRQIVISNGAMSTLPPPPRP